MRACGDAQTNLAEACRLLSANPAWIALRIESVWRGNAADMAWARVRELEKLLDAARYPLTELATIYAGTVGEMRFLEETTELFVTDMLDAAFFAAAAFYSAPTGIGLVVFGGAAIAEVSHLAGKVNDVLSRLEKASSTMDAFNSRVSTLGVLPAEVPAMPTGTGGR